MRSSLALLAVLIALGWPGGPATGAAEFTLTEKAVLDLYSDRASYAPGSPARIAAEVRIAPGWHVNSHVPTFDYLIPTALRFSLPPGWPQPEITYPPDEMQSFAFVEEPIAVYAGRVTLLASLSVPPDARVSPTRITAALTYQACTDDKCLPPVTTTRDIALEIGAPGPPANSAWFEPQAPRGPSRLLSSPPLWLMLGFAFLGGLILNAMPCVLPVLALKLFGLARTASVHRASIVTGSLAITAGIVVSFWGLALVALGLRAAGATVGWGIQFQEPLFIAALTAIVVLFSLNLWGIFEIKLPAFLGALAMKGPGGGLVANFSSGLFTTLMATPCTAPLLGTAVGFALAGSPTTILLVFTAIGLGMAAPYLVLAVLPGAARWLPRPGAWMVKLKVILGFMLSMTAVWLLYVLNGQLDAAHLAAFELCLLGIALALWLRGQSSSAAASVATLLVLLALLGASIRVVHTGRLPPAQASVEPANGPVAWEPFDRERARRLAAAGQLVFISVTADWCLTCKVNEELVLETPAVAEIFATHDVVPMRGDWTNPDPRIEELLAEHGRAGIPFYVLYRGDGSAQVLGEIISVKAVREAIEGAATRALARTAPLPSRRAPAGPSS